MGNLIEFAKWLESALSLRGWSAADLARFSGVAPAQISRILNGERGVGPDSCIAIARAFELPPEDIFRRAGLLPELPAGSDARYLQELRDLMGRLSVEEREDILAYVKWRYQRAQEKRQA